MGDDGHSCYDFDAQNENGFCELRNIGKTRDLTIRIIDPGYGIYLRLDPVKKIPEGASKFKLAGLGYTITTRC